MLPYLLVFALVLFLAIKNNPKIDRRWYYVVIAVFTVFAGIRDMIGGFDVYIYAEVYEARLEFIRTTDAFEYGFRMLFLFLRNFSEDRHFMFFVVGMLFYLMQSAVIKKHSPLFYLSLYIIFCKFYLMSFVYLRQELAMVVCWLAIPFITEKKYIKYAIFMVLAISMHKSALLFIPLYFVARIQFNRFQILLLTALTIMISLTPIIDFIFEYFFEEFEDLEETRKVEGYHSRSKGINVFYLIESFLLLGIFLYFKETFYKNKNRIVIANGYFLYILVTIFAVKNGAFIRFNWYYLVFIAIGLTYPLMEIKYIKFKHLYKFTIMLYFGLLFIRLLLNWDAGDLMPYQTIFEEDDRKGMHDYMEYRRSRKTYGL